MYGSKKEKLPKYSNQIVVTELKSAIEALETLEEYDKLEGEQTEKIFCYIMCRACEIIGGVVKDLIDHQVEELYEVYWIDWIKLRDRISHEYSGIDLNRIYNASLDSRNAINKMQVLIKKYS